MLVVGASASGLQIADELARSGRDVTLAVGRHTRMPRRYRGMDAYWWLSVTGRLARTIDTMPDPAAARQEPSLQLVGTSGPPADLDLGVLQHRGVRLVGRVTASSGGTVELGDDLGPSVADAERRLRRLLGSFDDFARCRHWDRELLPPEPLRRVAVTPPVRRLSLTTERIATVVVAAGYEPDYSFLRVPVLGSDGQVSQVRGRTAAPGLYVVGQRFQHSRDSGLIAGARHDARDVVDHLVCSRAGRRAVSAQGPAGSHPVKHYDAVVVGGRIAGAATALLLARAGMKVVVVERGRRGSDTVSTHAFMRAGVLQLSRWGLLDAIESAGTPPIRRTVFHHPGLEPVTVTIRPRSGVDALYAPRRSVLDEILLGAALEAGAELVPGTVTEVLRDENRRVTGVRLDPAGRVLADTARPAHDRRRWDRLRRRPPGRGPGASTGAPRQRHPLSLLRGPAHRRLRVVLLPGSGAGQIPTNDRQTCVFVGDHSAWMRALRRGGTENAFTTLLHRTGESLADRTLHGRPASRLHGWGGQPGHLRQAHGPGWALVGDAGYFKDPITTHGMTDALRDAQLLADAVVAAASGQELEHVAMARYQAVRDRLSHRLLEATEAVAAYDWDTPTIQRLLREVSASMSDELDHLNDLLGPATTEAARP